MPKSVLDIVIRTLKQGGAETSTIKGLTAVKNAVGTAVTAFAALGGAAFAVDKAFDATVGTFVQYAGEIENLKVLTGASAEETSRIVQMADDARVSQEELTKALKKANKEGFQPNLQGLGELSDQYLAIQDPVERARFLFDTFGKEGDKMAKIMQMGSAAIKANAAAIDDSLIVTEKAILLSKEYAEQMDNLGDMVQGGQFILGSEGLPATVAGLKELNKNLKEEGILGFGLADVWQVLGAAVRGTEEANNSATQSYTAMAQAMQETSSAAEEVQESFDGLLDLTMSLQEGYDRFAETEANLNAQVAETNAQFSAGAITLEERDAKLQELNGSLAENAAAMEDWSKRTVFSLVQARLAAEGGIDAQEFQFLIGLGTEMGIIDEKTAAMATSVNDSLEAIDLSKPQEFSDLWKEIIALPHEQVFTITTNGGLPTNGLPGGGYATGGAFDAGMPMLVHKDEIVVPDYNGVVLTRTDAMRLLDGRANAGGGRSVTIYGGVTVVTRGTVIDALEGLKG